LNYFGLIQYGVSFEKMMGRMAIVIWGRRGFNSFVFFNTYNYILSYGWQEEKVNQRTRSYSTPWRCQNRKRYLRLTLCKLPRFGSMMYVMKGDGKGAGAPPLNGIIGRKAGDTAFSSSKALKGSGITWSDKHLFLYLLNPGKHIPGNKMSFSGLAG
jgi:hypothetical protein